MRWLPGRWNLSEVLVCAAASCLGATGRPARRCIGPCLLTVCNVQARREARTRLVVGAREAPLWTRWTCAGATGRAPASAAPLSSGPKPYVTGRAGTVREKARAWSEEEEARFLEALRP